MKNATVPLANSTAVTEGGAAVAPKGGRPHRHNHHGERGRRRKIGKDGEKHHKDKKGSGHRLGKLGSNRTLSGQQRHRNRMRKMSKNKHKYREGKHHASVDSVTRPGEGSLHHHNQKSDESDNQDDLGFDDVQDSDEQDHSVNNERQSSRKENEGETMSKGEDGSESKEGDGPLAVDGSRRRLYSNTKKHSKNRHGSHRHKPNNLQHNITAKPMLRRGQKGKHFLKRTGKNGNPRFGKTRRNKKAHGYKKKNATIATARPTVIVTGSPGLHEQSKASGQVDITENQVLTAVNSGQELESPEQKSPRREGRHQEAEDESESNAIMPFGIVVEDEKHPQRKQEMQLDDTSTASSPKQERRLAQREMEKTQEHESEGITEEAEKVKNKNKGDISRKKGGEDEAEGEKADIDVAVTSEEKADGKVDTKENEDEEKADEEMKEEDTPQEPDPSMTPEKYAEWGIGPLRPPLVYVVMHT